MDSVNLRKRRNVGWTLYEGGRSASPGVPLRTNGPRKKSPATSDESKRGTVHFRQLDAESMVDPATLDSFLVWQTVRAGRTRTFSGPDEAILKRGSLTTMRQMIETFAVILALLCAGIFLAHAVDAYRAR
jgi:hypothetical protein